MHPHRHRHHADGVKVRAVNLALQGGGAHGAFTWGVLDYLLEDGRIEIEAISATSAGAMNAVVAAYGLAEGGPAGARKALTSFWRRISHAASAGPLQPTWFDRLTGNRALELSPPFIAFDLMSRLFSPYQFNPLNYNPLKAVLEQCVDFGRLRTHCCPVKLFLAATNVRTGKIRIFDNDELSSAAVLASGCLPFLFHAVEIDGEHYWDGGYMANPAIFPLIYNCKSADVVVIHINPLERAELPRTASEMLNRINEISFNSSLLREMRAISFVTRLIDEGALDESRARRMLIHSISADHITTRLGAASKLNADWDFLMYLHDAGRRAAAAWLDKNFEHLNSQSTIDIRAQYL
ncbi:patatin-like phospholipase family protein [Vineibacter terrae]|uniref:patatin-like phospholipase family protein n=1 Tax=Vineibacter terrae TaxID=2586908 RepID=UPI002E361F17|nr:patatin-like phospholipase family protein [Vineibacter terrae]HEX2891432.1 patatin-like phospholipase family protein [Vineibacter terrae]